MLRALGGLRGGLGRFLPCGLSANHCMLRSIGWERCGHGLSSRPLGFWTMCFLSLGTPLGPAVHFLLVLFRMRYCSANLSNKTLTWELQPSGGVAALIAGVGVVPLEDGVLCFLGPVLQAGSF